MITSAALADGRQPLPLAMDAVEDRAVALERMRAADRFEAAHQHVVRGVEEQHAHASARRAARA